jgi:hypothetical protein
VAGFQMSISGRFWVSTEATGGAYDQELTDADDHSARQRAFGDGAAILGTHLRKGETEASELPRC